VSRQTNFTEVHQPSAHKDAAASAWMAHDPTAMDCRSDDGGHVPLELFAVSAGAGDDTGTTRATRGESFNLRGCDSDSDDDAPRDAGHKRCRRGS